MTKQANSSNNIAQLENFLEFAPVAIGVSDEASERVLFVNSTFQQLFGYTLNDIPTIDTWYNKAFPLHNFRQQVLEPWIKQVKQKRHTDKEPANLEAQLQCKDGSVRQVRLSFTIVEGKRLFYYNDITDHWIAEQRLKTRSDMLEMVAKSSALEDVLTVIVQQIQQESPPSLCSVLLFDNEEQRLLLGAAPDFPDFYNQALHGLHVGPDIGSCGAAAFHNQRIIVEDIQTHPNWQPFIELAQRAGLQSCWSDPIRSADGTLLGTFAIYNSPSPTPSKKDIDQIQFASNLASIAIENHNAHQELERRAYFDYLTGLANRRSFFELSEDTLREASTSEKNCALLMMDVDHFKKINDAYGHDLGDIVLQHLAKNCLSNLPKNAILGRIGGEEFAILLPNTNKIKSLQTAETLRKALSSTVLTNHNNQTIHFTVSLGITFSFGKHCYIDELLREADTALYKAKQTGRDRVCVFNDC